MNQYYYYFYINPFSFHGFSEVRSKFANMIREEYTNDFLRSAYRGSNKQIKKPSIVMNRKHHLSRMGR